MAELTINGAQVLKQAGSSVSLGSYTAGAAITAGMAVYSDAADNNHLKPAQADGTAEEAEVVGIALHDAEDGQPLAIATKGPIMLGAAAGVVQGRVYVLSDTPGNMELETDLIAGYKTVMGVGVDTAGNFMLEVYASGVQFA